VVVPAVVASRSSRRVLTTSRVAAVPVSDAAGLAKLGVDPRAVVDVIARAYAKQVFGDGLFHADPHPGNLFVVDEPGAARRPRVLFVDFGLSRRLDPALRGELRRALHALVRRDADALVAGMERLGMVAPGAGPGVRAAVAGMQQRLAAEGGPLGLAGARVLQLKDEAKALLGSTPGLQLPHDLLLFAKTLSYVFALGESLAPEVDLVRASMPFLLGFLAEREGAST
jgi:predicted unusual protein kinase regulating ubiquinone biosynthesis (AarF/ABC1/UbiB family)